MLWPLIVGKNKLCWGGHVDHFRDDVVVYFLLKLVFPVVPYAVDRVASRRNLERYDQGECLEGSSSVHGVPPCRDNSVRLSHVGRGPGDEVSIVPGGEEELDGFG